MVQFISECMPRPQEPSPELPREPIPPTTRKGVLKELEVRQGDNCDAAGRFALRPQKPFSVTVRIALKSPPGDHIPFHVPDYTVRLMVRRSGSVGKVEERLVSGALRPGESEYESRVDLPPLPPGRYMLDAYTRVPYASIAECERAEIQVG
jgi:hypothetical protein